MNFRTCTHYFKPCKADKTVANLIKIFDTSKALEGTILKNNETPGERITMKKTLLSATLLTLSLVNPLIATAASNDKYPAANFSPSVIYLDKDVTLSEITTSFDPKYPAAYFKPKVIYP